MEIISIFILCIPLFMFLLLGLTGMKMSHKLAGVLGCLGMGTVLVLSYWTALSYFFGDFYTAEGTRAALVLWNVDWLQFTQHLVIRLGFMLDPISAMMLIVIPTISFMVHLYSMGYMEGEKGFQRYFAFLSLFSFSMLGLVVATNIFQMYIFWELVGASSYLLIGFFYKLPSAVSASKKAFIVTRFADLGFLLGILILSYCTQTFDFLDITSAAVANYEGGVASYTGPFTGILTSFSGMTFLGASTLTWALVLIFMGGMGKSAMLPLHIWLPDAMEGPTPVSALIHAATMVVAGVYLVARLFPLYLLEMSAMNIIAVVGCITAFYAAVVACTQIDIKRVLAFSTISQIAFMVTSLGIARPEIHEGLGFMASMFHLFTHAMFKALLFLGAGALIHAVHSNNYTAMHGLRKYMPVTHITFLIGCLAIAGIPPFAGFFSKDEILAAAFENHWFWGAWLMMVAGLTAFYMFRLYYMIFWWKEHDCAHHTPHDAPVVMSIPLVFLAAVSCVAGFIPFGHFVTWNGVSYDIHMVGWVAISSVCVAVLAILLATKMYLKENPLPDKLADTFHGLWTAAHHRFYWDELYMWITHKVIFQCICRPIAWFDRHIIDGTMDSFAKVTQWTSLQVRGLQSGNVQFYVWIYLVGALALGTIAWICLL
ncbi:NADH-quinone oxidoreductase subunit L [Muribaculum intestinale]|uniref:NADH-quinone oxidoreductase subunit L n=1 Tax=Muribaculum intestinale TaxID=1796646 RepID=UPI000F4785B0|nr:NADH-quinone oxidoreductase subunit L [Muribaculum intestinale]ROT11300.1 NADH-quinone oxidoreductase subunit L [Muribaculaceae bacterium Isolate-100 (HZI)]RXE67311.1 NADH-quinone oxidoreductase subunit L [Muribaculaceae bacterium Isolate-007 (NCI)]